MHICMCIYIYTHIYIYICIKNLVNSEFSQRLAAGDSFLCPETGLSPGIGVFAASEIGLDGSQRHVRQNMKKTHLEA